MEVQPSRGDDKQKILVIDDDPGILRLSRIIFERGGFHVLAAGNAEDALDLLDHCPTPDVIITNVAMPGMHGFDLCRILRSREDTRNTPIAIFSAQSDPDSITEGMEAGADDYILKPASHHELLSRILTLLNHVRVR